MPLPTQLTLLGSIRNSELFSSHWLKNRLPLEPEWNECQRSAAEALTSAVELWREQRNRVEQYGGEQSLEQAFIQPMLHALGWKLIYQTHLRGRKWCATPFQQSTCNIHLLALALEIAAARLEHPELEPL
jgi:hypothetical protein